MRFCISAFSAASDGLLWKRPGDFQTIETHRGSFLLYVLLPPYSAYVISHFSKGTNLQDALACMGTHLPT